MQILVKPLAAQPQRKLREHRVAGIFQRPRHRLRAVRRAPAANRAAVHRDPARAVKALLRACRPAVDRRGGRQHLERRARLVNVAEHGQAHQLVEPIQIVSGRVRRVVCRVHRHGEQRAGVHVHGDCLNAHRVVDLRTFAHGALHGSLNVPVDGQPQGVPLLGGHVERHPVGKRPRPRVHLGDHLPRFSGQNVVVLQLEAALPLAVHVAQPQRLRQQRTHRIPSTRVFVKCYSD